jgi:hypothetical protein
VKSNVIFLTEREEGNNFQKTVQVSLFWLSMDSEPRVIVHFLYREIHTKLKAQYGDDASSLCSVQRWCLFVRQGRENRHDDDHLGRSTLDFIDFQIMELLDRESFHSAHSLAEVNLFHTPLYFTTCKIRLAWKIFIFDRSHARWHRISTKNEPRFAMRCFSS